jgi:hypothetical protein
MKKCFRVIEKLNPVLKKSVTKKSFREEKNIPVEQLVAQ